MRGTTVLPGTPCATPRPGEPPMHRLELRLPDDVPFAAGSFDAVGPLSRAAFPHRHTFHEIVHVTSGTGTHVVDLDRWELRPPHLGVILPGQVHHWEDAHGLDGTVVLFTEDFLLDHGDRDLLRRLGERPWHTLDGPTHARTGRLMAELVEEHRHGADGFATVLRSLLHVLLVRTARLPGPGASGPPPPGRPGAVAAEFARLLTRTGAEARTVRECAGLIGVTPGHLTDAVRTATGRTPAALLREARTREAQRLLISTELSIRQVALRVGFGDPAYFCRFFRRETGRSPGDFRKHHDRRDPSLEAEAVRA
ncbi:MULTISPECIES: AraC family transcriptional regulator [Streptomyces]|uniref:helix-turn-helix transcriptional regulator n=1 Tax=Streptomyces TaxID=1883 RepID=UPI00093A4E4F|nr:MULTISPECIES: AraC family transcriptional regulator [Streptomyces]MBX9423586.1 AraC family transcriptional regulator [Streptomyces lateritius]OKJ68188.1 AraC family transcriptional regulator [Streptomyces sp. CB02261]